MSGEDQGGDRRGSPEAPAHPAPAGRSRGDLPRRLGEIITPALGRLAGGDEASAYSAWARAVGDPVSGGTRPKAFRRGQLTIECASSVWANELTYLGPQILRRMDEVAPGHPVKRFRFVVGRPPAPPAAVESAADDARATHRGPPAEDPAAGSSGAGVRGPGGEGEASASTARAGRAWGGAGPGRGGRRRTTPGGHRGLSATVIGGAPGSSGSRHPIRLTKTPGLRRFLRCPGVALTLRFWYTQAGRYCLPPAVIAQPLGHCEVV